MNSKVEKNGMKNENENKRDWVIYTFGFRIQISDSEKARIKG
jgi:hypothetical protein